MGFAVAFFPLIVAVFALRRAGAAKSYALPAAEFYGRRRLLPHYWRKRPFFRADREAGIIEQLLTSPHSLIAVAFGKAAAHWLIPAHL